jgi:glycosyltransferase involved in cell wall biosynthesis
MKIVMITTNDPASAASNLRRAVESTTEHTCRLVTTELRYNFMFEKDLHLPWLGDCSEIEQVLAEADIFHFHMIADENLRLGPFLPGDFLQGRKVVHHHHGEPAFRADPRRFAERELALGRRAIVSTPDLAALYPEAEWIPNPVPLHDPDYRPRGEYNHRYEIFVGHSPTRKDLKNTTEFREVFGRLARRRPRLRGRVIENTPHRECLRLKKGCDIFFDHMQGYFGVSSLEALSQGVPTIAGLDSWNLERIRAFAGRDEIPWVLARDSAELERRIEDLADDLALREEIGRASRAWMEACWNEEKIARRLAAFYEQS